MWALSRKLTNPASRARLTSVAIICRSSSCAKTWPATGSLRSKRNPTFIPLPTVKVRFGTSSSPKSLRKSCRSRRLAINHYRTIEAVTTTAPAVPGAAPPEVEARAFTLRQRFLLWSASALGYLAIRTIGPTLRLSVSLEEGAREHEPQHPSIYCFWHRCVFPATYCFRNHRIAVMTSRSFDGEYIARIIERAGYTAVRGSSSRGGAAALLGMHDVVEKGYSVAFTADGPRGPRYVAK